ncbi:MAG: HAMP domain-containing histidine kinase [Chlorogloeopsis fritschii C42_A2020_084]|uniref:GAF domain-containing sensor histidine kinase n=1 Tax=Chlorogloeopsis fritschii TaxID=1124 RepID=UPI001A065765|nr:GAF domain-containing sensor histidine kinase [Chlorogloeopsis fritschii]MBF2006637.1 HAMP domain-containing histidine kinase [Chlorogloeopsis fritschii C42_A2020_084]
MLNSPDLSFSRTLPLDVFNQLGELLEQMAQAVENGALVLTEAVLARIHITQEWQKQRFAIVISKGFSVLMVGSPQEEEQGKAEGKRHKEVTAEASSESVALPKEAVNFKEVGGNLPKAHLQHQEPADLTASMEIPGWQPLSESLLNVKLTFDTEAIASFVVKLRDLFECDSQTYHNIERYRQILAPNDGRLQSQFTLLLLNYFLPQPNSELINPPTFCSVSICQPVEDALQKQLAQERLLNQVTTQIRQSLDISVILVTAIEQVRNFLELDRLVICKLPSLKGVKLFNPSEFFNPPALQGSSQSSPVLGIPNTINHTLPRIQKEAFPSNQSPIPSMESSSPTPNFGEVNKILEFSSFSSLFSHSGCVIYESRASDAIPSVLMSKEDNCFTLNSSCWKKYQQGFTLAVDDVEKTYALEECLLSFLRNIQVRAKFVAPIVFEDKLWGLLIAHQCNAPHSWSESEKSLLTSIAEQLAIAIHQSELTRSLTQEKQTLEQRVIERTVALHDALVAAEAASRLRSEFLATISHELLTPLTYVIGMSSTLLRWSFGELNERQRDYLQTIHDSGEHLLEMINDILELSQIEAGKAVLNITEFSLVEIAEDIVASLMEKAISQQVNLRLDLPLDRQRDRFIADARRVEQILWNLLSNAIKFTPEGGNVTLRLWVEDDTAVFQVEDTGIGIPEEKLPLLFEKFHQLDPPYRRRYEGTGLGLALTKQLVELHRGRIEVESTVGVGSIFTVWIPIQPKPVLS